MFPMRRLLLLALLALPALPAALPVGPAEAQAISRPVNTLGSDDGVAIRGYDPVAYFTEGGPKQGDPTFAVDHGGAKWLFSSAANKALFEADPEKYLPAYGGFCAYGTSQGHLVKIEPEAWSIVDGRLYLNYDLSVRETWRQDTAGAIDKADTNWPKLDAEDIQ